MKGSKMIPYARYKQWWIDHQAPHEAPSRHYKDTPETQFEEHINKMSLFELMETLENWGEEVPVQEERDIIRTWNDMVEMVKRQPYQPMEQTPNFPRPYIKYSTENDPKPKCQKCGISLGGVMGYVCGDSKCPTFMTGVY
jgi:hypothetical protein